MSEQASKMWSGRFREPLNKRFEEWQRSFPFDHRLLPHEIAASKAHAKAIAAAGILTELELTAMLNGLDRIVQTVKDESGIHNVMGLSKFMAQNATADEPDEGIGIFEPSDESVAASRGSLTAVRLYSEAEDIHHFTELQLTSLVGPLALKLHTGRSRNEQIATDMRLFVRESIDTTMLGLHAWALALVELAERAGEAVMPSYTHLQRAEPVLIAHWLLAYLSMIERDMTRLADARKRLNFCPLGSGAIAGATLALDRTIAARELGFDGPTLNSMDATSDRDFALEFTQALSVLGLHISRFAEELTLYATAEFGFLELPEAFSTGSSAMPQKKNPDLTELIRGKSGRLFGASATLTLLIKGLPLAYNKDLQEGQEPVFDAADTIAGILSVLPEFTASLKFREDKLARAAQTGYLNAMAAATYLSNRGVPFRKAHEQIGNAVRFGLETGRELQALTLEELSTFGGEFAEDFYAAITVEATLDCHDVVGGTARHQVKLALADARRRIAANGAV